MGWLFDGSPVPFARFEIVYSPPQYPDGTKPRVDGAVIVVSTIGRDAREISARLGDFSLKAGPACETAAAVRAVTTTAAHRTRRRAEGERPRPLELPERAG